MPWGTIREYDGKKSAAAQKLPATQAEMHQWFPWELNSRIAYNLHDEAKLDDDKSIDASDFAKIQAYAATPINKVSTTSMRATRRPSCSTSIPR